MPWSKLVPTFLLLFLVSVALNSFAPVPHSWHAGISRAAAFFTTVALSAIGLSTPIDALRRAGWRPLALGGILWVAVATSSIALQALTGQL